MQARDGGRRAAGAARTASGASARVNVAEIGTRSSLRAVHPRGKR